MQKRRLNCPKCGTPVEATNPESKDVVTVSCPKCGLRIGFKFNRSETVIVESKPKKDIGYLMYGKERYELKLGINTIGRKSAKSTATIQIATEDMSVSRVHAEIEVVKLDSGHIKAILRDARDVEKTNIKPMYFGDDRMYLENRLNLENGDTFKMGEIIVKYLQ